MRLYLAVASDPPPPVALPGALRYLHRLRAQALRPRREPLLGDGVMVTLRFLVPSF